MGGEIHSDHEANEEDIAQETEQDKKKAPPLVESIATGRAKRAPKRKLRNKNYVAFTLPVVEEGIKPP